MFVNAIQSVEMALFPILRFTQDMPEVGKRTVAVVGSAFFIDDRGTFATVAHVFDNPPPKSEFMFVGRLPEELLKPYTPLQELARDDVADIYIGRVPIKTPDFLPLAREQLPIGRSVCVSGYPLAKVSVNAAGGFDFGGVKRWFRSTMVIGRAACPVDDGRRIHIGVLLEDEALFGMSGGAVVDAAGMVVGMQGSLTAPEQSTNGSRAITVENAVAISSDKIVDLYELALGLRTVAPKVDVAADAQEQKRRA